MAINDEFRWRFGIGPSNSHVYDYAYSAPAVVTAENYEAWRVYLEKLIKRTMSEETMNTMEFKQAMEQVREEKERQEQWRLAEKQRQERERRCRVMERPRLAYIPKGLTVDYEQEYSVFLQQEVTFTPMDIEDYRVQRRLIYRWVSKSVPQILKLNRPDAAFAIAITVCRHLPQFLQRENLMGYHEVDKSKLRKLIAEAFEALVESVTAWNNEEKRQYVADFIQSQASQYSNYRGLTKSLLELVPTVPFTGDVVSTQREKNDAELRQDAEMERRRRLLEQQRVAAEREDSSVIPLNKQIEQRIFTDYVVGEDGDVLDVNFRAEFRKVDELLGKGQQRDAALYAMQLIKSLCRHFVLDEHWNCFNDWYSPDYSVGDLMARFEKLYVEGKLNEDVVEYLRSAWKEIREEESYKDYGYPSHNWIL
jgi:hypothetical protein